MSVRVQSSRRGKMAIVTLDDGGSAVEVVIYNEVYDTARNALREDQLVIMEAKIMQRMSDDGQAQGLRIIADAVHDLTATRKRYARELRLACNGGADAARLVDMLTPFRNGSCPIVVEYVNHGIRGVIEFPETWRVNLEDPLLAGLKDWLTPENVKVIY
jgi:DNA polymerase-3 subunit alpha